MENTLIALLVTFAIVIILDVLKRPTRHVTLAGIFIGFIVLFIDPIIHIPLLADDGLALFFGVFFLFISFLVTLASKAKHPTYYASILLSTIGMLVAASARDILLLYVSIELVTVPAYLLIMYGKTRHRLEAGMKYFVTSIVASAFLLLGVGLLAVSSGTTLLGSMNPTGLPALLGLVGVLTGLGFKMGIFPFNFWIPDVYQGAPSQVAGFLASASKKAGFVALIRIIADISVMPEWTLIIGGIAALTMTIPNLIALRQKDASRMVAYSIMTHAGYLLMGLVVLSAVSLAGVLVHAFIHGFMALGTFLVLGVFRSHNIKTIDQMHGLGWKNKYLSLSLMLFLLSLAGLPVLAGFMSKLFLFTAVASDGLLWLVALALLNSGISLYYYFRIIRSLYGYKSSGKPYEVSFRMVMAIGICLAVIIFFGLYPAPLFDVASSVASSIFI